VEASDLGKRLRLRRADRCAVCGADLPIGTEAIWYREPKTVTCCSCQYWTTGVVEGQAGRSALREYERRHRAREDYARGRLGRLGVFLSKVVEEPRSTRAWRQGGNGEVATGRRLAKHLEGTNVRLLHDRRVPGHGRANIDHVTVGPGGVTVIDTKTHRGRIRVERVGGLFAPRRSVLMIDGRDCSRLIVGVERQIEYVESALKRRGLVGIEVRGALCFPDPQGLPLFGQLSVNEIAIDGPKPIAKLSRRPGSLSADMIDQLWNALGEAFPPA